jgi:hypothetical protein
MIESPKRGFTTEAQRTQRKTREKKREKKNQKTAIPGLLNGFSLFLSLLSFSVSSVPLW